jgi:hypothetical protein
LLPEQGSFSTDGTPSINMDHTANVVWLGLDNASFLLADHNNADQRQRRPLHPALTVIDLYRDTLRDMWNWHDLHVGPFGLECPASSTPQLNGTVLSGTPFVNAHYARQLQGWAIVRALAGQQWSSHDRTLVLQPPSAAAFFLHSNETVLIIPFFTGEVSGQLVMEMAPLGRLDASAALRARDPWLTASVTVAAGRLHARSVTIRVEHGSLAWAAEITPIHLEAGDISPPVQLIFTESADVNLP